MGVKVTGTIEPLHSQDTYPVIDPLYGIDGLRCVSSLSDMYNIPLDRRRGGMVVGVQDSIANTTNYYYLRPGVTWSLGTASNWSPFLIYGAGATGMTPLYNIFNETVVVPTNHQYLVYGNLTIGTGGNFQNYGKTVIINGSIVTTGDGTYSNPGGNINLVSLSTTTKYTFTFSASPNGTVSIAHGLNSSDIVYSVRDGNNFVFPNIEIVDVNTLLLTTTGTISNGTINVIK